MKTFSVGVGVVAVLITAGLVLFASLSGGDGTIEAPVTTSGPTTAVAGPGPIHVVEIASRPNYQVVRYEPAAGRVVPVFVIPDGAVVDAVAQTLDGQRLVLAYSTDFNVAGNGLYELSVEGGEPRLLWPKAAGTLYSDLVMDPNGTTIWATQEIGENRSVVAVDTVAGAIDTTIDNAVVPTHGGSWVAYLVLEPDGSRRSIGVLDLTTGTSRTYAVLEGRYDLDHLLADPQRNRLVFAGLVPEGQGRLTLGEPAGAHGAHDGPAQWLTLDLATGEVALLGEHEPRVVRDAVLRGDGTVLFTTVEGLVAHGSPQVLLLESRILTHLSG